MSDQITVIKLPKLGESISEATILDWRVQEGDWVEEGQFILEVGSDKVNSEIVAPTSGVLVEIVGHSDEVVKVGAILGRIDVTIEEPKDKQKKAPKEQSKNNKEVEKEIPQPSIAYPLVSDSVSSLQTGAKLERILQGRNNHKFYSPLVEKIARENYISYEELARIPSSGKDGRVRKSDIFRYLREGRPSQFVQTVPLNTGNGFQIPDLKFDKGKGKIIEMDRIRQLIADHMVFSKHTSPHVTAYVEADMTDMVAWREAHKIDFKEKYGQKLTFTPLFIEAVRKAIQDFPRINSSLDGKNIIEKEEINIGMATALPNGNLIVPVVKDTALKNLRELTKAVNTLAEKARNNKLSAEDTKGGTFTISNVGTFGSLMGTPIINQPEAAILATGIIKKRAEVIEYEAGDKIEIRQMMFLSLSFDHRIIDGYLAGSFLQRVADYFEDFKDREPV